jgi:hypothetical protein
MSEPRPVPRAVTAVGDDPQQTLRLLGARAHQLRATTRAADHYNAQDSSEDRNTGSWLMSCALQMAGELAADSDGIARSLRDSPADLVLLLQTVSALRVRAHQLHAVARAADHFLDQESLEDRDTGSWLVATASELAQRLASEIDDSVAPLRRPALDKAVIEPHDAALARRIAAATGTTTAATTTVRGAD